MAKKSMRKQKLIDQISYKRISKIMRKNYLKWPTGGHFEFYSVKFVMEYLLF